MVQPVHVEATGTAVDSYDSATFEVKIRKVAETGPAAKEKTREVSALLHRAIAELKADGVKLDDRSIRVRFDVQKSTRWNGHEHVFEGYAAIYVLQLTLTEVNADLAKVHDKLTSIVGAEVDSPVFDMRDEKRHALQAKAFEAAADLAKNRFKSQARILGLNPEQFDIVSWAVRYAKPPVSFKGGALDEEDDEHLQLSAGLAKVTVTLTASFAKPQ